MVEAAGVYALPFAGEPGAGEDATPLPGPPHAAGLTAAYLNLRKLSIFGGSNEIQKNIIAQAILGLGG